MPQTEAPAPRTETAPPFRLRWWTELPLILVVYGCYSAGRLIVRGDVADAVEHGLAILRLEKLLHLNAEHPLNRLFTREAWLGIPADFWYASLHYLVTPAILVWLFRSHTAHYRAARTWLMTSTFIGLIGFTLLPTCPPRLLAPEHGFVDTMAHFSSYGWWGDQASAPRGLGGMTNQYAAMPSLHVGWALWCGLILWRFGSTRWTKVAAVVYPLVTALVVMGTANHYLLDAVAGATVMGVGWLLAPYVGAMTQRIRAALAARVPALAGGASGAGSPNVSGRCQTSAGERIPRQRETRLDPSGEPGAPPQDAADGAPGWGLPSQAESLGKAR
ncbi:MULTISPECIES: phosphatase PAP2 family protein [Streptomyces]|uniref:Phosphatase PAP2 family protein n=1 Tax=Streptomyces thermoviolaceus subsp. thermoviolaceus TaxID=66860 RepID=A0ABX0YW20_STRTL|nr:MULTISPECIES: phosphatase PAP2 family protein [Streptomyces]WTD49107.1 phosphatase PAP2 family protein [Streptomyces thermoviolaceus]NJP16810.1 phosphatase PAP2 family protein [Streptomyces thermoviolaceus subsp. thermoviolaceus]RSR96044.1 phosphatase PAP2 family protein [Streptomyces sp. WAC00469]GGV73630.1 inositol phosphorylceramide synthase [Streptomyces thermoviolaceus subsp. apingens]GHB09589.1 inositol phosphorylceramide synthase [Streptomyces thermoviolaceus subsp. thermoviolaceus]